MTHGAGLVWGLRLCWGAVYIIVAGRAENMYCVAASNRPITDISIYHTINTLSSHLTFETNNLPPVLDAGTLSTGCKISI